MNTPSGRARGRLAGAAVLRRIGAAVRKACPPESDAEDATLAEYLYVPCARTRCHGVSAEPLSWVQAVPIVKKTANWIYYTSDSWNRIEAVVGPGCISRQEFETDTRRRHGYPAGVIPIPGAHPGSAGRLFFATRQAAEHHLYRAQRERARRAAPDTSLIKELRRAMANAHPDRGGTAEQFIEAHRRYQTALRSV